MPLAADSMRASVSDDLELLRAWKAGDEDSGKRLVQRHMRALYGFFRSVAPRELEDLIQRTWLSCLESAGRYRGDGTFRAFLFGIARHEVYGHYRRVRKDQERFDPAEASAVDLSPTPGTIMVAKLEHRLLLRALRQLPLDDQIALELSYWEGLTSKELSQALDVPAGTVRTRLSRARKALAVAMQKLSESAAVLESTTSDLAGWATSLRDHLREAEGFEFED